jgi:Cytochrome c554 and c-prime
MIDGCSMNGRPMALAVGSVVALTWVCCLASVIVPRSAFAGQGASEAHWNPVVGPPAGAKYVGSSVCAACHSSVAKTYNATPMAQAGALAGDEKILRSHPRLSFHVGRFTCQLIRQANGTLFKVSDGKKTITEPIYWAFGKGVAGQTYVFWRDGAYYQSLVSFYRDISGLGPTIGVPGAPHNLEEALGQRMTRGDAQLCIGCHTTGAVMGGEFWPKDSFPGVACEACHGPGARHVAAIQQGNTQNLAIINPGRFAPFELDNFCGSCHRTWEQVQIMGITDIKNVRFQPYRLEKSRCWDAMDSRISCLACHNPHQTLVRNASFYDSKCLACHLLKGAATEPHHPGAACPISTQNCTTCHMPRYVLPGGHFKFADHDIRIVRPGAPYPG